MAEPSARCSTSGCTCACPLTSRKSASWRTMDSALVFTPGMKVCQKTGLDFSARAMAAASAVLPLPGRPHRITQRSFSSTEPTRLVRAARSTNGVVGAGISSRAPSSCSTQCSMVTLLIFMPAGRRMSRAAAARPSRRSIMAGSLPRSRAGMKSAATVAGSGRRSFFSRRQMCASVYPTAAARSR